MLYVLEGKLTLHLDRERHLIRRGSAVLFKSDRPHRYANEHKTPLRFVMAVSEPVQSQD